jgi:predicted TPR repeat methyltransferase
MIPVAHPTAIERCLAALCGHDRAPRPEELAGKSYFAGYRAIARHVPSRPPRVRHNIAAVVHCICGNAERAIACLEASLRGEFSQYDFQALLADVLVRNGRWDAYPQKGEFGLEIIAALDGIARPPARYHPVLVGKLFDRLSGQYEERVAREGYAEHTQVARALSRVAYGGRPLRVLDLGCGTGMLGGALRNAGVNVTLVGVDLSKAMLEQARERAIYESLHREDIERFLRTFRGGDFEAAGLASVIPFFGDLRTLFDLLSRFLRHDAWLVFTYDVARAQEVEFNESGRFRHAKAHVEDRLAQARFVLLSSEGFTARTERGEPVAAEVVVARKG